MIKWFHFNWMDAKSAGAAVTVKNYFAAFTPSGIKETSLTLFQFALMGGRRHTEPGHPQRGASIGWDDLD